MITELERGKPARKCKNKVGNKMFRVMVMGAVLLFSLGCSSPKEPGGATPGKVVSTKTPVAAKTEQPASTPQPTPSSEGTPTVETTPAPSTSDANLSPKDKLKDAEGMPGYDDVLKLGKNPIKADEASINKGKELFLANCAPCHGNDGTGGGPAAAALDPKPRNLTHPDEYKYGTSDLAIYRTAMYGVPDTGMAGWQGRLKPDELWNIVNYVKSLQGK